MTDLKNKTSIQEQPKDLQQSDSDKAIRHLPISQFSSTVYTTNLEATLAESQISKINYSNTLHSEKDTLNPEGVNEANEFEQRALLSKTFGPSIFQTLDHHLTREAPQQNLDNSPKDSIRFEVKSKLGSGAFGDVFGAHDRDLNRRVARLSKRITFCGSFGTP